MRAADLDRLRGPVGAADVHRRADSGGCLLRLDNRPALLDRLLRRTGTLDLLTALPDPDDDGAAGVPAT
ncbi:hypothetical protein ACF1AX_15800 [Streptomyces sp. NPDC014802]|uniref:hypothetical protein n=1 Tax=Streptomyces sp. NPDC014802 TaxID=3364917 RepID=UPI0037008142